MHRRTVLAATAGLTAPAIPAMAQAPTPAPAPAPAGQAPGFYRFKVGAMTVTVVYDGQAPRPNPTRGFVRNATPEQVEATLRAQGLDPSVLTNPFSVAVVQTPRGTVMFDSGNGPQTDPNARTGQLIANLAAAGLRPDAVDVVASTHFHGDHIGGLLDAAGTAAFPRARIVVPEREWTFWLSEENAARAPDAMRPAFANVRRRFAPYDGKVERVNEGFEPLPGVRMVATNGHAPGHASWHLSDGGAQAFVLGDLTSRPEINLTNPGWHAIVDMDPVMAEATRRRMFDQLATDRIRAVGYHWPFPANGHVLKEADGYRFVPAEWSSVV